MKRNLLQFLMPLIVLSAVIGVSGQTPAASPKPTPEIEAAAPYTRPDPKKRFYRYVNGTVGPYAWIGIASSAGIATLVNEPSEWGQKPEGIGRRVASTLGKTVIKNTVTYGMDEALRLDSHFYPSKKRDARSRFANALVSTVAARNRSGERVIGAPRIVGTYTASIVAAETWYPKRFDWKDGVLNGTVSLGANAFFNLVKEFVFK